MNMLRCRYLVPLALAVLWTASCQPTGEREFFKMSSRIINGTTDSGNTYPAVVSLIFSGYLCSGTLVSSTYILTAGHCCATDNGTTPLSPSVYTINFGYNANSPTATRKLSALHLHPNYNLSGSGGMPVNDICLLQLSSAAPSTVTPMPYLTSALKLTSSDDGASITIVGFGQDNSGNTGIREMVDNNIDVVCESSSCDFDSGAVANLHTFGYDENPGGVCSGDSGGPSFLTRSGTKYVAGVTSYGDTGCQYFGVSTNVSDFDTSFINGIVGAKGALGASCSIGGDCQSNYCVDTVCCSTSSCSTCMACNVAGFLGTCHQVANNTPCPDGNKCNGDEVCISGSCQNGTALNCNLGSICSIDSCNTATGCVHTPTNEGASCSDGNPCNGLETCHNGLCVTGAPVNCDDNNSCTTDTCDSAQGGCVHTSVSDGTACNNGSACGGPGICSGGTCQVGSPINCDDSDPCTSDSCNPNTGCVHTPVTNGTSCSDNNVCNGPDSCQNGVCVPTGSPLNCDDGNICTQDVCDTLNGCLHLNVADGTSCGGGACGAASCKGGVCVSPSTSCDDGNACTVDSCDPVQGCQHTAINCDDGNPCSLDSCISGSCQHTTAPDGTSCGGGVCGAASCSGGLCMTASGGLSCDDQNPCTADACNPATGCTHLAYPDGYPCGDCAMCMGGTCSAQVPDCSNGSSGCGTAGGAGWGGLTWLLLAAAGMLTIRRKARP